MMFLPPASAVEVIKSVPSVCLSVSQHSHSLPGTVYQCKRTLCSKRFWITDVWGASTLGRFHSCKIINDNDISLSGWCIRCAHSWGLHFPLDQTIRVLWQSPWLLCQFKMVAEAFSYNSKVTLLTHSSGRRVRGRPLIIWGGGRWKSKKKKKFGQPSEKKKKKSIGSQKKKISISMVAKKKLFKLWKKWKK